MTRKRCPPRLAANTTDPAVGASDAHSSGATSPVSTRSTARSPSTSLPASSPWSVPAVGEADLGGAVAEVVGVGEDLARSDDDAGAPALASDGDGGGGHPLGDGAGGVLQLLDGGHPVPLSVFGSLFPSD